MDIPLLTYLLDIKSYLKFFSQLLFPIISCPRCKEAERIIKHGCYYRFAIDIDGERYKIPIQRFRCKCCKKTFSYLPPFLARYKPYCIQGVSPLINAYFTTPFSLFHVLYERYPYSPLDYRPLRSYLFSLRTKARMIYHLVLKELLEINPLWDYQGDPRFSKVPSYLKVKSLRKGVLDFYYLSLLLEHYLGIARAKFPEVGFPKGALLLLANQILFLNTCSSIF